MIQPQHLYHMFPLGMLRKNEETDPNLKDPDNFYNIETLTSWIDHLKSLMVDTVLLGPVFESETHGYDPTDLRRVDARLGTNENLRNLIEAFHGAGIKVVLDAVFNHTSREHFAYLDIREKGCVSKFASWYMNICWDQPNRCGDSFSCETWNGFDHLPKLNLENPDVQNEIIGVVKFWIEEFGIDGIRLDAADVMDINFLRRLSGCCHKLKPGFWMLGEVVNGDYRLWLDDAGLDSVTHYEGFKSLWSSFVDKNFFEIAYSMNRLFAESTGIYRNYKLLLFAENHDQTRISSRLNNTGWLYLLHLMQYTLPGIPSLYYGEEWGFKGIKQNDDDWNLRPVVHSVPPNNIPQSELLECLQRFIKLRQQHIALTEGSYRQIMVSNQQFAWVRTHEQETLIVVVNSADEPVELELVINEFGQSMYDLLDEEAKAISLGFSKVKVEIPACWGRIYKINRE